MTRLASDQSGASAAEMALVIPFLIVLMFGSFELGHYFLSEHVVQKAVRDAARYAARLPMSAYQGCSVSSDAEAQIQRIARTGHPDSGEGAQRLHGWKTDGMTAVDISCDTSSTYATGGIYDDFPDGAPTITVTATVPYPTLFGTLGIGGSDPDSCQGEDLGLCLTLNARSQSAVYGA